MPSSKWSQSVISMIREFNKVSSQQYYEFIIANPNLGAKDDHVGLIPHPQITSVIKKLDCCSVKNPKIMVSQQSSQKYFRISDSEKTVRLRYFLPDMCNLYHDHNSPDASSSAEISKHLNNLANFIKETNPELIPGWRGEQYPILYPDSIGSVERAAASCIFGIEKFGSHLTIYKNLDSDLKILVGKRAATKSTYPGYYDNSVAGGINYKTSPLETIKKEAFEEASITDGNILDKIRSIGTTSHSSSTTYFTKSRQFNFELDVTEFEDFEAQPSDGEVEFFKFCSVDEVLELLGSGQIIPGSQMLVTLQFLIEKGVLTGENTEGFGEIVKGLNSY